MESRINGTLKIWNESKGFGFITPLNGGQDIFVHISDYPKQGGLPKIGELLSFEIILNKDGKKRLYLFNGQVANLLLQRSRVALKQKSALTVLC